ncbi:MAG TPA: transposase [Anaerolineales bacterium]|nr:transposase [Anaerolineales bacterium]
MEFDPQRHHRRSIRLKGYDYAQPGAYFVTICTQRREALFGVILDGEMRINRCGEIVKECWLAIPDHFPQVELDAFVVMPNHIHGIIVITESDSHGGMTDDAETGAIRGDRVGATHGAGVGATHGSPLRERPHGPQRGSIGAIMAQFKSSVSRRIAAELGETSIWQRNYYEQSIRNRSDWERIEKYIKANPSQWDEDENNPAVVDW